ncbi:Mrp/NBP35 family ATP-binding protein [Sedimentimonas flavescens]|uniref:Iron-sulfur cluster carrier protein n=1 Tax=Sedimentimonas flavescens TaxID=2851012 RepID=A0ABT2ZWT3_9RHOB|nr:Mrp/NBP35 family ATP-binding protein [Sedimentimonas flavescens]MBW0158811.1 Mrp/NBP35 family ATP-binding protein [Sedimentimonas flavescens]MCT2540181.1 Mrp/NBP35 family ATP-binding protein [Sedimentimonas flavescens]MCV2878210.1 Mrp/NBP35 family ATP-binding protein [Sedimentimonas flavescens]WBL33962.1 Mrp/NBP35 family ATP-binding protein [Sinirhodobacter sp. HNIBRBA609]
MSLSKESVLKALRGVEMPSGSDPVSRDLVRALAVQGGIVRFVLEGASEAELSAAKPAIEAAVRALDGVESLTVVVPSGPAKGMGAGPKIGQHPTPQAGPQAVEGVRHIIAVGSGKGGVGKSTVSSNLAVALARAGKRVGLLDADIYGPSQPRMMGVNKRPASPDGKTILPLLAHGVVVMSIGLMLKEDEAVIWRGPMLMGALQQMLGQVAWDHYGPLDVLIIDLPPGTGDIQLTLCQKTRLDGALVVSTPQDVALLDAKKALDMFRRLGTPVIGLIENMSTYVCPNCGHEAHLFGHGGVGAEAERLGLPYLGELPLDLDVRLAGDAGQPVATGEGAASDAYAGIARKLIEAGAV